MRSKGSGTARVEWIGLDRPWSTLDQRAGAQRRDDSL